MTHPPAVFLEVFLRRADLLKPDVMSEVILLGAGALVFAILVLILIISSDSILSADLKPEN
jgi:hypothetical protein